MTIQQIRLSIAIFMVSCVFFGSVMAAGQMQSSGSVKNTLSPDIRDSSAVLSSAGIFSSFPDTTSGSISMVSLYAPCAIEKNAIIPVSALISGTDGLPMQGVAVTITGSDAKPVFASGVTDKNGQFSTDLVLPGDIQEITLVAQTDVPGTSVLSDPVSVYFY